MGFSDQLLGLLADQREALTFITSHPRTFVPAAVRWVERLGGTEQLSSLFLASLRNGQLNSTFSLLHCCTDSRNTPKEIIE